MSIFDLDVAARFWNELERSLKIKDILILDSKKYTGKAISRAGEALVRDGLAETDPEAHEQAMNALSFWRACHEVPLERAYKLLGSVTEKIDRRTVLAKRLKRAPSIIAKLKRFEGMKLRSMQDIGGCRAILKSKKAITKVTRELNKLKDFRIKDYIQEPKSDGYRGVHLIGNFDLNGEDVRSIEIQLRTKIQHSWATAVEIIDLFTGQAIKSSQGQENWKSFFRSIAEVFSMIDDITNYEILTQVDLIDKIAIALFNSRDKGDRRLISNCEQVYVLQEKLDVISKFHAFAESLKITNDRLTEVAVDGYVLLIIDVKGSSLTSKIFGDSEFEVAAREYLEAEKQSVAVSGQMVALVSTDAVGGIKQAYPNYFADSAKFIRMLAASIQAYKYYNPSKLSRSIKKLLG